MQVSTRGMRRILTGAALAATAVTVLAGCANETASPPVVTEVVTQTAEPDTSVSATASPSSTDDSASAATEVVTVVAVGKDGAPQAGWTVEPGGGGTLSCGPTMTPSPSATSDDIYSCSPSAAAAHTCWPTPASPTELLCASTPWDQTLRRLTSDVALSPVTKPADPRPWALELANGVQCTIRTGGAWGGRSDGYLGAYGCAGTQDVVLTKDSSLVDKSAAQWTVKVGPLGVNNEEFPPPATVGVVRAYFAGTQS